MINPMQLAIIKKDIRAITANKHLLTALIIVPLIMAIGLPTLFIMIIHFAPEEMNDMEKMLAMVPLNQHLDTMNRTFIALVLNYIMPIFFIIIPVMASTIMAATSFVGEKEKRTLETLLYCPLPLKQIFQAKVWAAFFLSMAISLISFVVMILVVEIEVLLTTGSMILPGISWLVVMLLIAPAVSLLAITFIVRGSAKAQTVEESQQRAAFLILPLVLFLVGQFTGVVLVSAWYLLGMGVILAGLALILMRRSMQNFTYEMLLK